jgi:hypothetical protein
MLSNDEILLLMAAGAVVHQFIVATYFIFLDSIPTLFEKRMAKKKKREMAPYKRNASMRYITPTLDLVLQKILENVFADENRAYTKKVTHLHAWQLLMLAAKLKHLIEPPRLRSSGERPGRKYGRMMKFDGTEVFCTPKAPLYRDPTVEYR